MLSFNLRPDFVSCVSTDNYELFYPPISSSLQYNVIVTGNKLRKTYKTKQQLAIPFITG